MIAAYVVFNKKCDSIGAQNSYLKNLTWQEEGSQFSVKLSGGLMTTSCHSFRLRMVTATLPDCHISEYANSIFSVMKNICCDNGEKRLMRVVAKPFQHHQSFR